MSKATKIILAIITLCFSGFFIWAIVQNQFKESVDYSDYSPETIYIDDAPLEGASVLGHKLAPAPAVAGGIADYVKGGSLENAKVILFEYVDYQCPGCAAASVWFDNLLEEYGGQVVMIHRDFAFDFHKNARSAALAANAAGLQGYWKPYADLLFSRQSEWEYQTGNTLKAIFVSYFKEVTDDEGDVERFQKDMKSSAVLDKFNFDGAMAAAVNVTSTPSVFYNGELIDWYSATSEDLFKEYFHNFLNPLLEEQ